MPEIYPPPLPTAPGPVVPLALTEPAATPTGVPLTVTGAAGQTGNLEEWKNSAGAVVANIEPRGAITGDGLTLGKENSDLYPGVWVVADGPRNLGNYRFLFNALNSYLNALAGGFVFFQVGNINVGQFNSDGSFSLTVLGKGLRVTEGANAKQGVSAAMVAGSVVIANTSITATSRIVVTRQDGGTNPGAAYVSARAAGASFTVSSTNAADTGTVAYQIFEPA